MVQPAGPLDNRMNNNPGLDSRSGVYSPSGKRGGLMKGKALPGALLAFGALLIAAGLIVKLLIVPALAQFPDDVDTTRTYAGVVTMLNRDALLDTNLELFYNNLAVVSDRTVTTEETDGQKALVRDVSNLVAAAGTAAEGTRLTGSDDFYTIDRKTMESIDNFSDNEAVLAREGLVIGFPIGTQKRDYRGWNGDPQLPVTLFYQREEERHGINTYVFTASSGPEIIKDQGTLNEFPAGVPRDSVPALLPFLDLPPEIENLIPLILGALPELLDLAYTYEFDATYWIDPTTGILIDIDKNDIRRAMVVVPGFDLDVPPIEVYNLTYQPTSESIAAAVDDAKSNGDLLQLGRTTGPFTLFGLGALSLLAAAFMLWRRGRGKAEIKATPPHQV